MQTIYDWVTLIAFSGLAMLFLQRSTAQVLTDKVWQYAPPAIGCAASNWFGNNGHAVVAIVILLASVAFVFLVLKPFARKV